MLFPFSEQGLCFGDATDFRNEKQALVLFCDQAVANGVANVAVAGRPKSNLIVEAPVLIRISLQAICAIQCRVGKLHTQSLQESMTKIAWSSRELNPCFSDS